MLAVVRVVAIRPHHVAGKVEGGETAVAEAGHHAFTVSGGGRCGIRVAALLVSGHLPEDFLVPGNCPGFPLQRQHTAGLAVVGRRGEKHAVAPDNGRGPRFSRNRRFPDDVLRSRPFQRQARFRGVALAGRAAKLRPILGSSRRSSEQRRGTNCPGRLRGGRPCAQKTFQGWLI